MNLEAPHKAIINISFSIYPVSATGELSGQCINRGQLNKSGLKHKMIDVKGNSYEECVTALKELMEKMIQCKNQ